MVSLALNSGDKISLPTTIEINGKVHKLFLYNSHTCKQLNGLFLIQRDLSHIKSSIEKHIANPSQEFELLCSLAISYRKLWKGTGIRYVKLEKTRDLKNAPESLLNFHEQLIEIGNKYVAHPDQTVYDQSSVLLIMEEGKAIGVYWASMSLENFDKDWYGNCLELVKTLENSIEKLIEEKKKIVIDEYNSSLTNKN